MRKYTTLKWTEYPVADGNYDETRKPIDLVVLHHTACTYQQAINTFGSPNAKTSAHYIISNKGELAAMLEEYNTAYHAGNYDTNQRSIGIETEWYEGMGDRTEALYEKVSALVADICKYHKIPIDLDHIKPHKDFKATQCPGTLDIPRIIDRARAINNPAPVETPLQACLRQHGELIAQLEALKKEHEKCNLNAIEISSLKAQVLTLTTERNEAVGSSQAKDKMISDLRTRIDKAVIALQQ